MTLKLSEILSRQNTLVFFELLNIPDINNDTPQYYEILHLFDTFCSYEILRYSNTFYYNRNTKIL